MKANCLACFVFLILAGCATTRIQEMPRPPIFDEYEQLAKEPLLSGSECPDLRGDYSVFPRRIKDLNSGNSGQRVDASTIFSLFPFYLAESNPIVSTEKRAERGNALLSIAQPSNSELVVLLDLGLTDTKTVYSFQGTQGDFECDQGILKFPIRSYYGGIEGQLLNGQIRNWITRVNNNILIIRSIGPYKSFKQTDQGDFEHEYTLFTRLNAAVNED